MVTGYKKHDPSTNSFPDDILCERYRFSGMRIHYTICKPDETCNYSSANRMRHIVFFWNGNTCIQLMMFASCNINTLYLTQRIIHTIQEWRHSNYHVKWYSLKSILHCWLQLIEHHLENWLVFPLFITDDTKWIKLISVIKFHFDSVWSFWSFISVSDLNTIQVQELDNVQLSH